MTIIEESWLETLLHVLQNIYYKLFLSKKKDLFKKEYIPNIDWNNEHTAYHLLKDNQKVIFKSWIQNILYFHDGFTKVLDNNCLNNNTKSFTNCSCSYNNRENIINNNIYNDIDYVNINKTINITNYNN